MSTTLDDDTEVASADANHEHASEKYSIVEFDGKDDRWDPKNFPEIKKWFILFAVSHGAVIVTCTSSLYVRSSRLRR
jgi:hypothetical protein